MQARRLHRRTAGLREVTAPVDVADKHARLLAYTSQLPVLDEHNRPSHTVWDGKPDVYHAYQALLLARMPLAPVLSVQLAEAGESRRLP